MGRLDHLRATAPNSGSVLLLIGGCGELAFLAPARTVGIRASSVELFQLGDRMHIEDSRLVQFCVCSPGDLPNHWQFSTLQ